MKSKLYLLGCLFAAALVVTGMRNGPAPSAAAIAKVSEAPSDSPQRYLPIAKLEEGWQIPALAKFRRSGGESVMSVAGAKVVRKILQASTEPLVIIEQFRLSDRDEVLISRTPCYISGVVSYSVSGKVFAYEVSGVVSIKQPDGRIDRSGGVLHVFFYDEKGDGKFQTREVTTELTRVPSWVNSR